MLLFASIAFADVVPILECPVGAVQRGAHSAYCAPAKSCDDGSACRGDTTCTSVSLHLEEKKMVQGGRMADEQPRTFMATVASECGWTGNCNTAKRCVPSDQLSSITKARAMCGCSSLTAIPGFLAIGLAAFGLRRRT